MLYTSYFVATKMEDSREKKQGLEKKPEQYMFNSTCRYHKSLLATYRGNQPSVLGSHPLDRGSYSSLDPLFRTTAQACELSAVADQEFWIINN